ncbi:MAG: hypothetical protein GX442_04910 [Candidatus Riflebacteria bacterium]|nr:hypothetical protein [Candidatus Riflebacteria bacterium]
MRKLFVLLLVALVPVMIGCRLVENDDTGADVQLVPTSAPAAVVVTPKAVLPNTAVTAAVPAGDLRIYINGVAYAPTSVTATPTGFVTVVFQTVTVTGFSTTTTSQNIVATLTLGGESVPLTLPVSNSNPTSSTATQTTNIITMTFPTTGSFTPTLVVAYENGTTEVPTVSQPTTTVTVTSVTNAFAVDTVKWNGATLTAFLDTAVEIASLTPTFDIKLTATAATLGSYTFECVNVTDNNSTFKVTEADTTVVQLVSPAPATDTANLSFKVVGTTSPKALEKGKTYKVTFTSTLKQLSDSTKTITSIVRYFKTSATAQ